ncbi:MAG TPA: DUF1937 family protein [Xanthobacteraceae bacterium]|nr:DUF1937 family protein [Xanthobacteraceae bacterium]
MVAPKSNKIIYLACPYTHSCADIREQRFVAATKAAASLIQSGYIVFSPVTMTHPIDSIIAGFDGTLGSEFWVSFDEAFMEVCAEMAILPLDGWRESSGISREIDFFIQRKRRVWFLNPTEDDYGVREAVPLPKSITG